MSIKLANILKLCLIANKTYTYLYMQSKNLFKLIYLEEKNKIYN